VTPTTPEGKRCPACGRDIGIWAVFAAGLPTRIRCPHCKARLSYRGAMPIVIVMLLLLGPVVYGSYRAAQALGDVRSWRLLFAGLVLVAWAPIELGFSLYLRARRDLQAPPAK